MDKFLLMSLDNLEVTLRGTKPVINFSLSDELKKKVDFAINDKPAYKYNTNKFFTRSQQDNCLGQEIYNK
jgi:hypothetical protein